MLGDASGLVLLHVGVADFVQEGGLACIDVAQNTADGRTEFTGFIHNKLEFVVFQDFGDWLLFFCLAGWRDHHFILVFLSLLLCLFMCIFCGIWLGCFLLFNRFGDLLRLFLLFLFSAGNLLPVIILFGPSS